MSPNFLKLVCLFLFHGTCMCQMDLGSLLGVSMATGGLQGGLGGPNGAMAIAGMTGMTGDMTAADLAMLNSGVKAIVGNHAAPDMAMIQYASSQGGPPTTPRDMVNYLIFMLNIAKNKGIQMPNGTIQHIGQNRPSSFGYIGNGQTIENGKMLGQKGGLTQQQALQLLTQRAQQWFMTRRFANTARSFMF